MLSLFVSILYYVVLTTLIVSSAACVGALLVEGVTSVANMFRSDFKPSLNTDYLDIPKHIAGAAFALSVLSYVVVLMFDCVANSL